MDEELQAILQEFLAESGEALDQVENDLVALERDPHDLEALRRIFRAMHTIKGTCGFLGLARLERVAHAGEGLLARLRDGELAMTEEIASALLALVDAVRGMLAEVERTGTDGSDGHDELVALLGRLKEGGAAPREAPAEAGGGAAPREARTGAAAEEGSPAQAGASAEAAAAEAPAPPESAEAAPAAGTPPAARGSAEGHIRVDVALLDRLMNLVGELVLTRNQIQQFADEEEDGTFSRAVHRLDLITRELQQEFMKTRMQPVSNVWSKFPRVVRDLAREAGKRVRVEMEGKETELDRSLIEAIRDPLTHLVRNAVDHGIEAPEERRARGKPEEGLLRLSARHEGGHVVIEIEDDGGGLPTERIRRKAVERGLLSGEQAAAMGEQELAQLIFQPGFSTAEKVTKISGRGVGMDVVKTNIETYGGTIEVDSRAGRGTTVRIHLPLTLAIMPALVVACAGQRFAVPQASIAELIGLAGAGQGIEWLHGAPVYRLRGQLLPLAFLDRVLGLRERGEGGHIVVIRTERRAFGLVVDDVVASQEIVVKPLPRLLKGVHEFAGCTIMGDGRVVVILDVLGVAQRGGLVGEGAQHVVAMRAGPEEGPAVEAGAARWLVVDSTDGGRMALPLEEVVRLEELPREQIDRAGERLMARCRGQILPLAHIADLVEERRRRARAPRRLEEGDAAVPAIVCAGAGGEFAVLVEGVVDIVPAVPLKGPPTRGGVRGTAVVHDRVTEVVDTAWLAARMAEAGV
ncbi:chemotaxis protein CheA [Inmirania thermothiophila]|uniref:Chemotaxis protein CheA n=1 Tax=Inmirania thermothiophila TaxID=1750597 RepID=A0A3N1Y152_9GAMM|nr:chemotaxis protein CheA [Inmirania thermothiophila]ROR32520.1 two-component system chemotaxis sensor kinase CheA [Inmirania thermothiophila]